MTTIDYDAPHRSVVELDKPDAVEGFELPGVELTAEEPTMSVVVPMLADEFRCSHCFLVCHRSQRPQT
jgi:hypothetical protein